MKYMSILIASLITLAVTGMALSENVPVSGTAPMLTEYTPGVVLDFTSSGDVAPGYDSVSLPYRHAYVGISNQDKTTVKPAKSDPVLDNYNEGVNISHDNDYTADVLDSLLKESNRAWDKYIETPTEALKSADRQDWENHRLDLYYGPKGSGVEST